MHSVKVGRNAMGEDIEHLKSQEVDSSLKSIEMLSMVENKIEHLVAFEAGIWSSKAAKEIR